MAEPLTSAMLDRYAVRLQLHGSDPDTMVPFSVAEASALLAASRRGLAADKLAEAAKLAQAWLTIIAGSDALQGGDKELAYSQARDLASALAAFRAATSAGEPLELEAAINTPLQPRGGVILPDFIRADQANADLAATVATLRADVAKMARLGRGLAFSSGNMKAADDFDAIAERHAGAK